MPFFARKAAKKIVKPGPVAPVRKVAAAGPVTPAPYRSNPISNIRHRTNTSSGAPGTGPLQRSASVRSTGSAAAAVAPSPATSRRGSVAPSPATSRRGSTLSRTQASPYMSSRRPSAAANRTSTASGYLIPNPRTSTGSGVYATVDPSRRSTVGGPGVTEGGGLRRSASAPNLAMGESGAPKRRKTVDAGVGEAIVGDGNVAEKAVGVDVGVGPDAVKKPGKMAKFKSGAKKTGKWVGNRAGGMAAPAAGYVLGRGTSSPQEITQTTTVNTGDGSGSTGAELAPEVQKYSF